MDALARALKPVQVPVALGPPQLASVQRLTRTALLPDHTFPSKDRNDPENAQVFLYLAAGSHPPELIAAALDGLVTLHDVSGVEPSRDALVRVLKGRLDEHQAPVRARAIAAARLVLAGQQVDLDVLRMVEARLNGESPAERFAALQTLAVVRSGLLSRAAVERTASFLANPHEEAFALAQANLVLRKGFPAVPDKRALADLLVAFKDHSNDGVRGTAFTLLAEIDPQRAVPLLLNALADRAGFVRASAATALGWAGVIGSVHLLVKLVDDHAKNTVVIDNWKQLDGSNGVLRLGNPAVPTVAVAAMLAIEQLSAHGLELERVLPGQSDRAVAANAKRVRRWYARRATTLPRPPTVSVR